MRYKLLVIFLLVSLSACSFQVNAVTPPPTSTLSPEPSPTLAFPSDIPPLPTSTFTPIPTSTFTQVATPIALQESVNGIYSIQFAPGGTYVDIVDSLSAGASKTYSINASQGQVMSISFHLSLITSWTVIPMKIVGRDGSALCPTQVNVPCYFWHGTLPATQEYFVTLMPDADVFDFTMRVAIDPPGTTSQTFSYNSRDGKASFTYTDVFAPYLFPELYMTKFTPELALQYIDTKSFDKTNLSEAYFLFGSSNDPSSVATCVQPPSTNGTESVTGEVNVNGISFTRSEGSGVGAGNIYEQTYYRTVYNGTCYEITFFVHSTNVGNYPADSGVHEFDRAALTQKFESILFTLVIK